MSLIVVGKWKLFAGQQNHPKNIVTLTNKGRKALVKRRARRVDKAQGTEARKLRRRARRI